MEGEGDRREERKGKQYQIKGKTGDSKRERNMGRKMLALGRRKGKEDHKEELWGRSRRERNWVWSSTVGNWS